MERTGFNRGRGKIIYGITVSAAVALLAGFVYVLWVWVPAAAVRYTLLLFFALLCLLMLAWCIWQRRQVCGFAEELCRTLDDLMAGREVEERRLYEDTLTARVQGKFLQYCDQMRQEQQRNRQDKQTIQELVSDISHQVKTPAASLRMFLGILRSHRLDEEKRAEFLQIMETQIGKLEFLMEALIKMSRLETGTFALHMEKRSLYDTIAQAISGVWAKAEAKNIELCVECDKSVTVCHDAKWTAEAIGNILDNAVKYSPEGADIRITVRPWQFYTRMDITDGGIGIPEEHRNDVFKRFYRGEEVAQEEGVGLGLYLAQGIIVRQRGYISVRSKVGEGTTFSVYLLS